MSLRKRFFYVATKRLLNNNQFRAPPVPKEGMTTNSIFLTFCTSSTLSSSKEGVKVIVWEIVS